MRWSNSDTRGMTIWTDTFSFLNNRSQRATNLHPVVPCKIGSVLLFWWANNANVHHENHTENWQRWEIMADNSALRTAGDLGPLRIQTPPKAGYGAAAMESPLRLQYTPPRDSFSTNPQPHSYLQAMSAPAYIQIPSFEPQKESSSTASRSGTPNLVLGVPPGSRMRIPYRQSSSLVDEFRKPEGLRRSYVFLAYVCNIGIPIILGLIALMIYLCMRPQLPRVTINAVNLIRFNAVGGLESGWQNPTLASCCLPWTRTRNSPCTIRGWACWCRSRTFRFRLLWKRFLRSRKEKVSLQRLTRLWGLQCGPGCGWWHVLAIFHFKRRHTFACADWRESVCADGEVEFAFLPSPLGLRLRYKSSVAFTKPDALVQEL